MSLKNCNDIIGNRTRDLPVCRVMPYNLVLIIIIIIITYLVTYLFTRSLTYSLTHSLTHSLTCLLQLSCHSVAVVLTLVQTKQIRMNIHKRNNTKTQYKQYKTQEIQVHILLKHPHIHSPTHLQNKLKQPQYKVHTK